jgi:type I restriction enzyme, R subunit
MMSNQKLNSREDEVNALAELCQLSISLSHREQRDDYMLAIGSMVEAEQSDLFDVLAYIAYSRPPITRAERVSARADLIYLPYDKKQREFLHFVLDQYERQGVGELDVEKLKHLVELKYHSIEDAVSELGSVAAIRDVFIEFQQHLYAAREVA